MWRSCVCVLLLLSGALALPSPTVDDLTSNDYYSWIFVVGEDGYVVKTSDAGATWQCSLCGQDRMALTQGATLNAVHFFTSRLGYVAGNNGVIIKTVNGGANWAARPTGVTNHLYGIHVFQPLVVYAVGSGGLVLKTDNGGDTWNPNEPLKIPHWASGVMHAPTLRAIRFTDSRNAVLVGECNVWFVTADGGESWTSTNLTGVGVSNYNGTGINYLAMDRFANMIAVGRKGLIYTITRQVAGDSDLATFVWTKRVAPGVSGSVDMHAASGYNASFFTVAGGPSGYLAVSHSLPGDITLEHSPISGAVAGNNAMLRLTSVYTPSIYTTVAASDSGKIFVSQDMTNSWRDVTAADAWPADVPKTVHWRAMSGRNAHDEVSAAHRPSPFGLQLLAACCGVLATVVTWYWC